MGMVVKAKCTCGLDKDMLVGAVRATFKKRAAFPARCARCRDLVGVNVLADPPMCGTCGSAQVTPLAEPMPEGACEVASGNIPEKRSWLGKVTRAARTLTLHDRAYLCPRCDKADLRFSALRAVD